MEIKYQLEPTDLDSLNAFVHRGTVSGWIARRPYWFFAIAVVVFGALVFNRGNPVFSGLVVLLFLGLLIFFWKRRKATLRKRATALFAPTTLTTSAEGVQTIAPGRSSTAAWSQFLGYGETADHIFLMLDLVTGYIVPKRGQAAADVAAFIAELQQYTKPLPAPQRSGIGLVLKLVLAWFVLILILLAWHFAQIQRRL